MIKISTHQLAVLSSGKKTKLNYRTYWDEIFQKLVGKIWKQKPGILLVVIFSQTSEGLTFFADSINPNKKKSNKSLKLALCGKISKKTKITSDLLSDNIGDILQWSNTVSQNLK